MDDSHPYLSNFVMQTSHPRNSANNTDPEVMVVGRAQDYNLLRRLQQTALEGQTHRFLRVI